MNAQAVEAMQFLHTALTLEALIAAIGVIATCRPSVSTSKPTACVASSWIEERSVDAEHGASWILSGRPSPSNESVTMPIPDFLADLRRKVGHELILVPTVVVIARDAAGRLLMVHDKDSGDWTLPGGIIEPGEAPADAAVREVFEEAGVTVTLARIVGVIGGRGCETTYANGDRIAWVATVFAGSVGSESPIADGVETLDAKLFTAQEVSALTIRRHSLRFLAAEREHELAAYYQPPSQLG